MEMLGSIKPKPLSRESTFMVEPRIVKDEWLF